MRLSVLMLFAASTAGACARAVGLPAAPAAGDQELTPPARTAEASAASASPALVVEVLTGSRPQRAGSGPDPKLPTPRALTGMVGTVDAVRLWPAAA